MEHDEVYPPIILSPEGSAAVEHELKRGTPMTPERAATFERMRQMAGVRKRRLDRDDVHSTTILSPEGSADVEEELKHGTPMTPGRRAMLDLARTREATWEREFVADAAAARSVLAR